MSFQNLSDDDLRAAVKENAEALRRVAKAIEELTSGAWPIPDHVLSGRKAMIDSHRKVMGQIAKEHDELWEEFINRQKVKA